MTGLLLATCFAAGIALIWLGTIGNVSLPAHGTHRGRLRAFLASAELHLNPVALASLTVAAGLLAALLAWSFVAIPALAVVAGAGAGWTPLAWARRRVARNQRERERAWAPAISGIADALEAGVAFPAAVALAGKSGPTALRSDWTMFHARLRSSGLEAAIDGLAATGERSTDTVAVLLRAGVLELPAGGLAPVLRELAQMLSERFEAREKARSRAASLRLEAGILALSPIALLLLVGSGSPEYLDAYRTSAGTFVGLLAAAMIFGCYLMMLRLGRVAEPRRTGGAG